MVGKIYPFPGRFGEHPVALTVVGRNLQSPLSPLFAKARWIARIEPDSDSLIYLANEERTKEGICDLLLERQIARLICGFIDPPSHRRLVAAGIDVRLGPCSVPALALIRRFDKLPPAP